MITNELHYRNFISGAVSGDNSDLLNADTEAPTEEDSLISTVEDENTRAELLWMKYLKRLKQGAWGDHLTVQALANMLSLRINIISTLNPDMESIKPTDGNIVGTINLGLIQQFHYVALFPTEAVHPEADMKWPDVIQCIAYQYGQTFTEEQVKNMTFQEKSKWLRSNPVTAARHFHYRLNTFFQKFLKSCANPLGKLTDYAIRIEFQARGSPHAHTLLWIKGAPKYGVDDDQVVCDFIDQYVTCKIPSDDEELKDMILLLQRHSHSSYCRKRGSCQFNFPKPPSPYTLIASKLYDDKNNSSLKSNKAKLILKQIHKEIEEDPNQSLQSIPQNAKVSLKMYMDALQQSSQGTNIVLEREPSECAINSYNTHVMRAWQANMDIQFVTDAYACVMYIASYMMKNEKGMSELLKQVGKESRTEDITEQLRRLGSALLYNRQVSAQEAAYRLLSIPMKQLSRSVVFLNTNTPDQRIGLLKPFHCLEAMDDSNEDIFQKSLLDHKNWKRCHMLNLEPTTQFYIRMKIKMTVYLQMMGIPPFH